MTEHRPVLHMELMLEAGFAIARDWAADKKGALKHLLRAAVLLDEIKDDFYFTSLQLRALMGLVAALAPIGRLLGYGTGYREACAQSAAGGEAKRGSRLAAVVGGAAAVSLIAVGFLGYRRRRRRKKLTS